MNLASASESAATDMGSRPDTLSTSSARQKSEPRFLPWGGVRITEIDDDVEKLSCDAEVNVYSASSQGEQGLRHLEPYIPHFRSVRPRSRSTSQIDCKPSRSGAVDVRSSKHADPYLKDDDIRHVITVESLLSGMNRNTVSSVDFKLGTVHYGRDATEANKARHMEKAKNRTVSSHGLLLRGAKIVSVHNGKVITDELDRGYGITLSNLTQLSSNSDKNIRTLDTTFVRLFPGTELDSRSGWQSPSLDSLRRVISSIKVLDHLDRDIDGLKQALQQTEWRFPGSSVFIAYGNADTDTAEGERTKVRVGLIDFAKAYHVPGQGPDEGAIKGCESLLRLTKTRRDTLASQRSLLVNQ